MAYLPFLGILSQTWAAIQSKDWCIAHGDWNPAVDQLADGTWVNAHQPTGTSPSPLDNPTAMMGSGPFEFNYLDAGIAWSIIRNGGQPGTGGEVADPTPTTTFWGGWAQSRMELLGFPAGTKARGYVDEIVEYFVGDDATRIAGLVGVAPIYDNAAVPRSMISQVWQQAGIKPVYPLASQAVDAMFFSYDVSMNSPYIGTPTGYGYFGQLGITPDFFSDLHARKAIAYSFNWPAYIGTAFLGEAGQVGIPLPPQGYDPYYNGSAALMYGENIPKAIEEWKQAWGGTIASPGPVWTNGFTFDMVYNTGNLPRQTICNMIKAAVEAENPGLFNINVVSVAWNAYGQVWHGMPGGYASGPIYVVGWLVDYPDPDDWVVPFISPTGGTFAYPQHLDMDPYAALYDQLIVWGARNTTVSGRNANYQALWKLYHDQAISLPTQNAFGRRFTRDWVQGWYYNAIFPGVFGYPLWKEDEFQTGAPFAGKHANWEDTNDDGKVDTKDLGAASKAFGAWFIQPTLPPNPVGPPGTYSSNWNSLVDINVVDQVTGGRCDMKTDTKDLATIAKLFGFVADAWAPGP
jgi:peptide/nickel transport system substrate-binding protein